MTPISNDQEIPAAPTLEPPHDAARAVTPDKFEAIREILVGDEFQNFESRFHILETSIDRRQSQLRSELITEFGNMHVQNQSEIKNLGEMVGEMVGQLKNEDGTQARQLDEMGKRIDGLEKRIDEMNNVITEQVRKFQDEFSDQMAEFSRLAKSQQEEAAREAISRKDFAEILSGLAATIASEESPAAEPAPEKSPAAPPVPKAFPPAEAENPFQPAAMG
ncbi:MAG: hypothetical protein HKN82_15570 [Akkermansiaceae bacterium]|nr:hypothetical protein [Akkermansiaceae bacterium]NNM30646.1 hypothetical protein [Akkermansiaceae bacterium]